MVGRAVITVRSVVVLIGIPSGASERERVVNDLDTDGDLEELYRWSAEADMLLISELVLDVRIKFSFETVLLLPIREPFNPVEPSFPESMVLCECASDALCDTESLNRRRTYLGAS